MSIKKLTLMLLIFTAISCSTKNKINPDNYIYLEYYKDKYDSKVLSHIIPRIKPSNESIGEFINNHRSRFAYFFSNKIEVDTLEKLYPDTLAINKIFLKQINEKKFISNFSKLANLEGQEYESFSMDEILEVASRFFVIVDLGTDFGIKICSGGNDFQDLNAIRDFSLIEALTYEAIINGVKKKGERPEFISNVRIYCSDAMKNPDNLNHNTLLVIAKNKLYKLMEKDESLRLYIGNYLTEHSDNLPFKIKKEN